MTEKPLAASAKTDLPSAGAPAASPTARPKLSLYYYDSCFYCLLVRREIDRLGLDVELRNVIDEPEHRTYLVRETGRQTVPALLITWPDGNAHWMREAARIVRYLRQLAGRDTAEPHWVWLHPATRLAPWLLLLAGLLVEGNVRAGFFAAGLVLMFVRFFMQMRLARTRE